MKETIKLQLSLSIVFGIVVFSSSCSVGTIITGADCGDGIRNGSETDIDCGGDICDRCASGANCIVESDCIENVCENGICISLHCDTGYTSDGSGNCIDVDECMEETEPCDINATCSNTEGGFICTCNDGYEGDGEICTDINECIDGTATCHEDAICSNTEGGFDCTCLPGFVGDGFNCYQPIDCTDDSSICHTNATCTDQGDGTFLCICNSGYQGDGLFCSDVNECTNNTHNCDPLVSCINLEGSFECGTCPPGYEDTHGNGTLCTPYSTLLDAHGVPTGIMNFLLSTGNHRLYVDGDYDSGGWILIGRGREDWAWNESGIDPSTDLSIGLGTPDAFPPRYLSTAIIQELINNTGIDLTDVHIRIKRAAATDGSSYQETIWQSLTNTMWTWLFETNQYDIYYRVEDSSFGPGIIVASTNTRDTWTATPNDYLRTQTWTWSSHDNKVGFGFGSSVIGANDPDNFFWQYATENHAIPYSEVYIRYSI